MKAELHLLITDSGVGGLCACAELERALRLAGRPARLTYFNAWPDEANGYNDLPTISDRAKVFDRALESMAALGPRRIVIACNTLSIVFEHTAFRSRPGAVPVSGIIDAGVELFGRTLAADPGGSIALFGTRTTIESDVHRSRLVAGGVDPGRITPVGCHGLAKAIETDMSGREVAALIDECAERAAAGARPGDPLYLGVCCTHYTHVRNEMVSALARFSGRDVRALDPNEGLVGQVMSSEAADGFETSGAAAQPEPGGVESRHGGVTVTVLSKVTMSDDKRRIMAARVTAVSPATAAALVAYTHVPDLF